MSFISFNDNTSSTGISTRGLAIDSICQSYEYTNALFKAKNGRLYIQGAWSNGSIPTGGNNFQTRGFREIPLDYSSGVKKYGAGNHAQSYYVLMNNGELWFWGYNGEGATGEGNTTRADFPKIIAYGIQDIVFPVSVQYSHAYMPAYVKDSIGNWYKYGRGVYGTGTATTTSLPELVVIPDGSTITDIYVFGGSYGCAFLLTDSGKIYANGYNGYGQLGVGNTVSQNAYREVLNLSAFDIKDIQGGHGYYDSTAKSQGTTVFLLNDGQVFTCGDNDWGQLGLSLPISSTINTPQPVTGIDPVDEIFCQGGPPMAVICTHADKQSYTAWGYNSYGQLGVGNTITQGTPVNVPFQYKKIYLTNRGSHTYPYVTRFYALGADDNLYSWGDQTYGSLGIGTNGADETSPIKMETYFSSPVKDIQVKPYSGTHQNPAVYILLENGELYGLGYGSNGMISSKNNVNNTAVNPLPVKLI